MKLSFHKSPTFTPAEYDAIIPRGGGYYVGIFRVGESARSDWHARILDKAIRHRLAGFEFSARTKRELVSWLNRHQGHLREATQRIDNGRA